MAAVAKGRRAFGCLAEWAIKTAGVFDRIAHDRHVLETFPVQPGADRGHHAIDHARRRDDVGAGLCVHRGRTRQQIARRVVEQVAFGQMRVVMRLPRPVDQPAVAVVGVFAEAHVGDDDQLRRCLLYTSRCV